MGGKAIVETIRKLAITKQLNFLIDLGASLPAISLMSDYSVENRNDALLEKVKEKSNTINSIFKLNNLSLQFIDDLIVQNYSNNIFRIAPDLRINEERIQELINKAEILYSEGNYSGAVEKIWDVFERIKTYYAPSVKKNKSVERVIDDISKGNTDIRQMFENEFRSLIDIGNSYCIRYHEVGKITVSNGIHFEYFYKRCFAVISVVLKELQ